MARNKNPEKTVNLILEVSQRLFLEKGYENTSIQDIINSLGGLSKGAIYHHFKSKEEILNAVGERYNAAAIAKMEQIRDDENMNGCEKLRNMFKSSLSCSEQELIFSIVPNMEENSRFLLIQLHEIFDNVAPNFIYPVIEQGVRDCSIKSENPKRLAELIALLANIWLSPIAMDVKLEVLVERVKYFGSLLKYAGMDFVNDELLADYEKYCNIVCSAKQKAAEKIKKAENRGE